jgi:two-component system sensor histidine kinase BaeS
LLAQRSPEEYRRVLASIVDEAERLGRLVERLLLLSRTDANTGMVRCVMMLDDVVEQVVMGQQGRAAEAGLTLETEIESGLMVEGDSELLRQAIDNLIRNALQYTPAGGLIQVRAKAQGDKALVEVSDTGVGIAAESIAQIFDRFYRTDRSRARQTGGMGLGLSIVKAVTERHGGTVSVTSSVGRGSRFCVYLPLKKAEPNENARDSTGEVSAAALVIPRPH